jgi:hypothetical protein
MMWDTLAVPDPAVIVCFADPPECLQRYYDTPAAAALRKCRTRRRSHHRFAREMQMT